MVVDLTGMEDGKMVKKLVQIYSLGYLRKPNGHTDSVYVHTPERASLLVRISISFECITSVLTSCRVCIYTAEGRQVRGLGLRGTVAPS